MFLAITLVLVLSILGISYAYLVTRVVGNETASSITASLGKLEVTFADTEVIQSNEVVPGWKQTKTFTVQNTGSLPTTYSIKWDYINNNLINKTDLVYSLVSANGGTNITDTQVPNTGNDILIANNVTLALSQMHTYTFTIEYLYKITDQSSDAVTNFSAKLKVQ